MSIVIIWVFVSIVVISVFVIIVIICEYCDYVSIFPNSHKTSEFLHNYVNLQKKLLTNGQSILSLNRLLVAKFSRG